MAAAMLQLARTLGYEIIAEGVERPAQEDGLRDLGCHLAQGYFLGKPLGAADTGRMLVERAGGTVSDRRQGDRRRDGRDLDGDGDRNGNGQAADHDAVRA